MSRPLRPKSPVERCCSAMLLKNSCSLRKGDSAPHSSPPGGASRPLKLLCPVSRLIHPSAVRNGALNRDQHHLPLLVGKTQCEHLRSELSDLSRRKVDN